MGNDDSISFVELELNIYRHEDCISVQTRTRIGRSFWDLQWQNKTISLLKALFGGTFITDEGKNKLFPICSPEPSKIQCSLYLAKWVFDNDIMKISLSKADKETGKEKNNSKKKFELDWIEKLNTEKISNNILIPYLVGCWEAFFRNSFISLLQYSSGISDKVIRRSNLSSKELLPVLQKEKDLGIAISEKLSFQNPSVIADNFQLLNTNIDIALWLKKPYHNRKKSLFDSISEIIEIRNAIVHEAYIDTSMSDKKTNVVINDFVTAVERVYCGFAKVYNYEAIWPYPRYRNYTKKKRIAERDISALTDNQ